MAEAFDLSKADPRTLCRYDTSRFYDPRQWQYGSGRMRKNIPWYTAHTKTLGELLLLARRLCEAGCGVITIHSEFVWDVHPDKNNVAVPEGKRLVIEPFDHAVSAFIEDCAERGPADDILLPTFCWCAVARWGGHRRSIRMAAATTGRVCPSLAPLMLSGGGIAHGQVIGRSTRDGSQAVGAPLKPDDLMATMFHTLFDDRKARLIPIFLRN